MACTESSTKQVVEHHIDALIKMDVNEILSDYTDKSVLFTPDGPVQGLTVLRQVFESFLSTMPDGLIANLEFIRKDYVNGTAYLLWKSGKSAPMGTDTFWVDDGKIMVQTFAAYMV